MKLFLAALAFCLLAADDKARTWHFDKKDEGDAPAGWTIAKTGMGEGSIWRVAADASAPSKSGFVLSQLAQGPSALFNLCVVPHASYRDLGLKVAFKANKGILDQ